MANGGLNTNRSQFFITFSSCDYLNNKHSIFGKLVGGFPTLTKIEQTPTTPSDKPKHKIIIQNTTVYINPFRDAIAELRYKKWKHNYDKHKNDDIDVEERWRKPLVSDDSAAGIGGGDRSGAVKGKTGRGADSGSGSGGSVGKYLDIAGIVRDNNNTASLAGIRNREIEESAKLKSAANYLFDKPNRNKRKQFNFSSW